jgi:hyaluronan synthase
MATDSVVVRRVCVIDGNGPDDIAMAEVGEAVFQTRTITLDFLPGEEGERELDISQEEENICITQPHKGKRNAMFTGFRILLSDPRVC